MTKTFDGARVLILEASASLAQTWRHGSSARGLT